MQGLTNTPINVKSPVGKKITLVQALQTEKHTSNHNEPETARRSQTRSVNRDVNTNINQWRQLDTQIH